MTSADNQRNLRYQLDKWSSSTRLKSNQSFEIISDESILKKRCEWGLMNPQLTSNCTIAVQVMAWPREFTQGRRIPLRKELRFYNGFHKTPPTKAS